MTENSSANLVSDYNKKRFLSNPSKYWNIFYKNNTCNFFRDRHWTLNEFKDLQNVLEASKLKKQRVFEIGCGVGNFVYPIMQETQKVEDMDIEFYACDYAPKAIELFKANDMYNNDKCHAFVADITADQPFKEYVPAESINLCSMIFVLSALQPSQLSKALENMHQVLAEGGIVIFRDYAVGDYAQHRFETSQDPKCIERNLYLRQDGTLSYFFQQAELEDLFKEAGFEVVNTEVVSSRTVNRKQGLDAQRLFLQGVFKKVSNDSK
ncbi:hypothetical protein MIR68_012320 [Amoeboaphelidium protococcarum]|nr:hypothetical protein MIR68_012320 [Amoeboaphelidium protococcarum]